MTVVAEGRSRPAAQSIAQKYRSKGYTTRIEEQYHPHGPGRAFRVITTEDVPRGTGAVSGPRLTPEESAEVRELFSLLKVAKTPKEQTVISAAIEAKAFRPKEEFPVEITRVRDVSGKITGVSVPGYVQPRSILGTSRYVFPVVEARKEYKETRIIPEYVTEQIILPPELAELGITEPEYEEIVYKKHLGFFPESEFQDWYTGRAKIHYEMTGRIPGSVDIDIPESISAVGASKEYSRLSYEMGLGIKSESTATEELRNIISSGVSALPDIQEIEWYKKYGGPEGTGVKLEPSEKLEFRDGQLVIATIPKPVPKERSVWDLGDWWEDTLGTLGGGIADLFAPTSSRLMEDWMIGPTYQKITGSKATKEDMWRTGRETWRKRWEKGDWVGAAIGVVSSPLGLIGGSYLLGKGMGGLAATKLGQKELFQIGFLEKQIASAPAWTYKYTVSVTPAKLAQAGVAGYFGYKAVEGGMEAYGEGKLGGYLATIGLTLPLVFGPYKAGYYSGVKWVQRRGGMGTVTDSVSRVRQKAGYDLIDETYKLPRTQDYYGDIPYDIKQIKQIGTTQADVFYHMATDKGKMFWTGSGALKAQYHSFFRTGQKPPGSLESYALWRQQTYPGQVGARPTLGYGPKGKLELVPKDIDVYFRAKSGIAEYWDIILSETKIKGFDIHTYKAWQFPGIGKKFDIGGGYGRQYIELGISQMKPVKTTVLLRGSKGVSIVQQIPSIADKEQLLRMTRNLLPSKSELYGHRTYKDVSTWTDISDIIKPTAHAKWIDAYRRFVSPELYPSKVPKVTLGEKLISKIGGHAELVFKDSKPVSYGYSFLYPESYAPIFLAGAYPVSPYKTDYKTPIYPTSKYVTPSYPVIKIPSYKTPTYEIKKPLLPSYPTPGYPTPDELTLFYPIPPIPEERKKKKKLGYTTPSLPDIIPPIFTEKKKKLPLLGTPEKDMDILGFRRKKRKKGGARKRTHPVRLFEDFMYEW